MSEKDSKPNVEVNAGMGWIALVLLIIFTVGTPDLIDGLLFMLSGGDADALTAFEVSINPRSVPSEANSIDQQGRN